MKNTPVVLVGPIADNFLMPSLSISILKGSLARQRIHSKAIYTNLLFNRIIGLQLLMELSDAIFSNLLLERIFAPIAYDNFKQVNLKGLVGAEPPDYLHELCQGEGELKRNIPGTEYSKMESRCKVFLKQAAEMITNLQPRIIGFSNAFQPVNGLIALARMIKRELPDSIYVIGGANCDGVMGEEIAASMEIFDYVFQGEADFAFPEFCHNYLEDNTLPREKLIRCSPPHNLDEVSIPDYSDFFEQSDIPVKDVILPYESSRGCWWGEKNQCTFCGESKVATPYRFKNPKRSFDELFQFLQKYPDIENFLATDSIFPTSYFQDFLPKLTDGGFNRDLRLCFRPNLTYKKILQIKQTGIKTIFVGIESLSTRLLALMNKGTTALTNLRLLRDCRELDIEVLWNLLVGLPGDRTSDYEEQLRFFPFIQHVSPTFFSLFRLQRFSPYFKNIESYKITQIKPIKDYYASFPESVDVTRLAYYFEGKYPSESRERPEILVPLKQQLDRWCERWSKEDLPELSIRKINGENWILKDTRDCAKVSDQIIYKEDYSLLESCRSGAFRKHVGPDDRVRHFLDLGYLIEVDGKLLSVVCESNRPDEVKRQIENQFYGEKE